MADRTYGWIDPHFMDETTSDEGTASMETVRRPNVVSSLCSNGMHSPVLDIDFAAQLIPSSTPGHFHLYLDGIEIEWEKYRQVLQTLGAAKILGAGYVYHSIQRGFSVVRLPHDRKPRPRVVHEEPF